LRNLNTFPKALLAVLCGAASLCGLDSRRPLAEIPHDQWGPEQGFSWGAVHAITQTEDGYLWIGTDHGLVRFDGASFRLLDAKRAPALPSGRVLGLLADHKNNLWIRFSTEGLFRYRNGRIVDMVAGQEDRLIEMMYRRGDGTPIFQSTWTSVYMYAPGTDKLTRLGVHIRPVVTAPAETSDGTLWLGTRDDGLLYFRSPQEGIQRTSFRSGRINCLAPAGGRELWIGMDDGVALWDGVRVSKQRVPSAIRGVQALSMMRDRDGNLWIGTSKGLLRVADGVVSDLDSQGQSPQSVDVLFEDREGGIWFGGSQGLQRLRENPFVTYSEIPPSENVAEDDGPLWADAAGRIWFAPSTGGLYWRRGYTVRHIENKSLDQDVVYSITGGPKEVWVGRQNGGLTRLEIDDPRSEQTYTARNWLAGVSVYCVHRSRDGAVWAGTIGSGVRRFKEGRFETFTAANGLASNSVTALEEGRDGTMWFATTGGLSAFLHGRWRTYNSSNGLTPGDIISLADDGPVLWIGTSNGLAMLRDDRIVALNDGPDVLHEAILGIVVAPAHENYPASVWIATGQRVLRVDRELLLSGKVDSGEVRVFDAADGLRGRENLKCYRSVITDHLGTIWFSTDRGVAAVNPAALARRSLPPIVHIQTVTADERALSDKDEVDVGGIIRVPSAPHRVAFGYIGLGLADPAGVLFRYRLDGYDTSWSNPTPSRESAYTNLGPGAYRFRVMARNPAGAWSSIEAAAPIYIAPLFWQTWWFLGAGLFALGAAAIGFYRLRTYQLTTRLNLRFEERVGERTRIARELHDTLLQSFQGSVFEFQAARKLLSHRPEEVARALDQAIASAKTAMSEGRDAIHELRTVSTIREDLVKLLTAAAQECSDAQVPDDKSVAFRVTVEGRPQALSPVVQDELYRIGRELLRNAFRHARAKQIEVEIRYSAEAFRLRVRDDGIGIDPKVLETGARGGHWGLPGVRERARLIGADFGLWSEIEAGAEVQITVPASLAYRKARGFRLFQKMTGYYAD
jgi:signal transduction histidine kinase/ligand-binding sensor domain-containing protein